MNELHIERMTASVIDWPDPEQVPAMLRHVAEDRLDAALRAQPLPEGDWCVRRLDVVLDLDPDRPLSALETGWADRIVTALRQSLRDGSSEVVRYERPEAAVDELLAGLVAHRYEHAWAWQQVGLLRPADPRPEEDPRALFLAILARLPHGMPAAIARLIAGTGVAPVHRLLGADGWRAVAVLAAAAAGVPWQPARGAGAEMPIADGASAGSPTGRGTATDPTAEMGATSRVPRAAGIAALDALSTAVAASGTLARAFQRCGLRVDGPTTEAWAVLALADVDPVLLHRPGEDLSDLVRAMSARLQPEATLGLAVEPLRAPRTKDPRHTAASTTAAAGQEPEAGACAEPHVTADPELIRAGSRTEWGGLLFLLNAAAEAGIPESLDEPPFAARPSGWVLHALGRELVDATADDPALLALAGLDRAPADDGDEIEQRAVTACAVRWAASTAARLRRAGVEGDDTDLVAHMAARHAIVAHERGWVELTMALEDVDLDIRRAGLDIDPGWVPWLGHVVRFRYE